MLNFRVGTFDPKVFSENHSLFYINKNALVPLILEIYSKASFKGDFYKIKLRNLNRSLEKI